jgi:hypothetical protein
MKPPLVSVVIPTYHYGSFVVDTVESMLALANMSILGTARRCLRPSNPWVSLGSGGENSSRDSIMSDGGRGRSTLKPSKRRSKPDNRALLLDR